MTRPAPRVSTRVIALSSAAAVLSSLGLSSVAVPSASAADSTPNTSKLAGALAKQKLTWEKCDYKDADLNSRFGDVPNVQCATVKVPRDWHDAKNGKTWDIRISKATNIDVKNPRYEGTMFVNPGGPGGSGLPWAAAMQQRTPDLNPYYNYIGFDPRGVGQSSTAPCTFTYTEDEKDPNAKSRALGETCSKNADVRTINTEQTAYDMDFIRHLVGAPKLSYTGYSYGTWLGAWYSNIFGKNADRMLLDSSTDVTLPTLQKTWDAQPIARDRQFDKHMINWIARHDATYKLGTDPYKIRERYFEATKNVDPLGILIVWALFGGAAAFSNNADYPAAGEVVALLIEVGESPEQPAAATPAQFAQNVIKQAQQRSKARSASTSSQAMTKLQPLLKLDRTAANRSATKAAPAATTETTTEAFDYIRCNDGQWTQGEKYWDNSNAKQAKKAPLSAQWGMFDSAPACAFWRTSNMMPVANAATYPKTFVVQGELDSQTAWETGLATATKLPNTKAIFIDNEGSHGHFPYGTECVDRPLYDFFLTGKQKGQKTKTCQALPLPTEDTVYESWGKLNNKGKHVSQVTSAFQKAESKTGQLNEAARLASVTTADPAVNQSLESLIRTSYGAEGVAAAKQSGLLAK